MKRSMIFRSLAALALCWFALGCKEEGGYSLRVYVQVSDQLPEDHRKVVVIRNPPMNVSVNPVSELSEYDLKVASAVKGTTRKQLVLQFDAHGARAIEKFTAENRGGLYVLTINAVPVVAAAIRNVITDGKLVVDVDIPDEELDKVVKELNKSADNAHTLDKL
jgi:hypothetical protein